MLTWTDQPYQAMWGHLRLLSHESNARRLLQNDLGGHRKLPPQVSPLLEQKAAQLAYCILQGHEYYQAAESVTINTSPLLYFYGMLSLAKAVIVANTPDKLLADVKYHGLHHDKAGRAVTLDDQTALHHGGVFDELVDIVAGFRYPRGAAFRFKDVLSISPELMNIYERYYGEPSRCIYAYRTQVLSQSPYKVEICPAVVSSKEAYDRIPELAVDFDLQSGLVHSSALAFHSKGTVTGRPDYLAEYHPVVGGKFIVGGLPYSQGGTVLKRYLSPHWTDYIAMYILSDCVRYQQDLWGSVVQGKQTGVLGLVDLLLSIAKRRFPNAILNQLFGESFEYGSPGRLI